MIQCYILFIATICNLADVAASSTSTLSHRSVQLADDESYLPSATEHEEWYLPNSPQDMKIDLPQKTFLFGSGDASEWGGDSTTANRNTTTILPALIKIPTLSDNEYIIQVSAGGLHSALVTNEGRILTAGSLDEEGRGLGRDVSSGTAFMPVTEVYPFDYDTNQHSNSPESPPKFAKVVASQHYTFALDKEGKVWSTGTNSWGNLCLNDTSSRVRFHQVVIPKNSEDDDASGIFIFSSKDPPQIVDIILGERHTILLRDDGIMWGCGWNQYGQLSIGLSGDNVLSPVEISIDAPDEITADERPINFEIVIQVAAGRGSTYFLTKSKHIYSAGTNFNGQLCLGHRDDRPLPSMLKGVEAYLNDGTDFSLNDEGVFVKSIAAGKSSFYILLSNGQVLSCGDNDYGQLGIGLNGNDLDAPTVISTVTNVAEIFSGPMSFGAFFVNGERKVFEVGFGVDVRENRKSPNVVACSNGDTSPKLNVMVASGNDLTLYLATMDTSFECAESGGNSTLSPVSLNVLSRVPTFAPIVSSQPTQSSMPSSTTRSPTSEPAPSRYSSIGTAGGIDKSYMPTTFFPTGVRTKVPVAPSRKNFNPADKSGACVIKCVTATLFALGMTLIQCL